MKEKTLLYSALIVTAIAAGSAIATVKARATEPPPPKKLEITPISLIESAKRLAPAEVPIRLTASDGTGLKLVALRAEAALEDPLALTELHLTFENPQDRVLEGTFRITLPQGASLSRFAMKVNDDWQEGEVVEKQAARQAYEDFLHRKQDPALLEQAAGNEFSARVFPIPARQTKEIIITYAESVEIGAPYVLPLRGLPELGTLDVNVHVTGTKAAANGGKAEALYGIHQARFTPAADFVIDSGRVPRSPGLRSGNLTITRVIPFGSSRPEPIGSAVVLVDTSASRGLGLTEQVIALQDLLRRIPGDTSVVVACFDQDVAPIYTGKASGFGDKEVSAIIARGALGASDFEHAITWAGIEAKKSKASRVVFLTDGVATAGEVDAQKLRGNVEKLRESGVARMDAIAIGGIRDDGFLRTVVHGVLDRDGVVLDAKLGGEAIAHRLGEATTSGVAVKVDGARWSYPSRLDGLQSGDEVLVYAEYDVAGVMRPLNIDVGGQIFQPDLRTVERPLVERAWAQAKIQSLIEDPHDSPGATKQEIISLSTRHRVLSPHTALLVLENDSDYARFNIDRTAKVDILGVHDGRIAVSHSSRTREERERDRREAQKPAQETTTAPQAAASAAPLAPAPVAAPPSPPPFFAQPQAGPSPAPPADMPATVPIIPAPMPAAPATMAPPGIVAPQTVTPPPAAIAPAPVADERPKRAPAPRLARPRPADDDDGYTVAQAPKVTAPRPAAKGGDDEERSKALKALQDAQLGDTSDSSQLPPRTTRRPPRPPPAPPALRRPVRPEPPEADFDEPDPGMPSKMAHKQPYEGRFKSVMDAIAHGSLDTALNEATRWHADEPGDILSLVALGEVYEARKDLDQAARAYGSILELFSFRADSRRFAGERLERLRQARALALATDSYAKAVEQRPDHPASHRLYAYALLKKGEHEKAFGAIVKGVTRSYPEGRFRGVERIMREDAGLIAAAWARAQPNRAAEIKEKILAAGGTVESGPSMRFVLVWETDANDVDFHISDGRGGHAYYAHEKLASGGELYADVTTGYGPECFTIRGARGGLAFPYTLQAHYYARGPMGYGMGKLQIIEHDGKGGLTFAERPFVVMVDEAFVDLGKVERGTKLAAL